MKDRLTKVIGATDPATNKKYIVPLAIWVCFYKKAVANAFELENWTAVVALLRPWKKSVDESMSLTVDNLSLCVLVHTFHQSPEERKCIADILSEVFFSNEFCCMFKVNTVQPVRSLCKELFDEFKAAENGDPGLWEGVSEEMCDPWDEVQRMTVALLALAGPKPIKDGDEMACHFFAPENVAKLSSHAANLVCAARAGSKLWDTVIEGYWIQANKDRQHQKAFEQAEAQLCSTDGEYLCPSDIVNLLVLWPGWLKDLRRDALKDMSTALLKKINAEVPELLNKDLPKDESALIQLKDQLGQYDTLMDHVTAVQGAASLCSLKRDVVSLLSEVDNVQNATGLESLLKTFDCTASAILGLQTPINNLVGSILPPSTAELVMQVTSRVIGTTIPQMIRVDGLQQTDVLLAFFRGVKDLIADMHKNAPTSCPLVLGYRPQHPKACVEILDELLSCSGCVETLRAETTVTNEGDTTNTALVLKAYIAHQQATPKLTTISNKFAVVFESTSMASLNPAADTRTMKDAAKAVTDAIKQQLATWSQESAKVHVELSKRLILDRQLPVQLM